MTLAWTLALESNLLSTLEPDKSYTVVSTLILVCELAPLHHGGDARDDADVAGWLRGEAVQTTTLS